MIDEIHIEGFKALLDVTIQLGHVNVFIGENGSGKSSILEAIGVLGAAVDGIVDATAVSRRGVRQGLPALYKTSLDGLPYRRVITLEARGGEPSVMYRVGLDNPLEKPMPAWRYHTEMLEFEGKLLMGRSPRGVRFQTGGGSSKFVGDRGYVSQILFSETLPDPAFELLESLRQYRIFSPVTPVLQGVLKDESPPPLGLAGGGLAELVESLLASERGERLMQALEEMAEWVASLEVLPPSKARVPLALPMTRRILVLGDQRMRKGRNELSAYDASEGILYLLFTLVLALHPELPLFLAVDNAGYGLHPRLSRVLIKSFCDLLLEFSPRRQVLLTTHDPLLLDGLPLWDDRVRLFVVEREATGAASVRRVELTEEQWAKKKEQGLTLSDLWVEGWLGGVPNLW